MSLVDSDHIEGTSSRRDCHYFIGAGDKPSMKIWQRGEVMGMEEELICDNCLYIPFYPDINKCPRCGGEINTLFKNESK